MPAVSAGDPASTLPTVCPTVGVASQATPVKIDEREQQVHHDARGQDHEL